MRALLLLFFLAGCATTTDLATTEADQLQISNRPIADVSRCLQLLIDRPERLNPSGQPVFELRNNMSFILATLTLIEDGDQVRIELRRANNINILPDWRSCA